MLIVGRLERSRCYRYRAEDHALLLLYRFYGRYSGNRFPSV